MYVFVYVCVHVYVCIYIYMYVHVDVHVCIYVYAHVLRYACTNNSQIFIYIYIHIYICSVDMVRISKADVLNWHTRGLLRSATPCSIPVLAVRSWSGSKRSMRCP